MFLRRLTPAAQLPLALTLEEAKLHLRVDGTEEDTLLTGYIHAAAALWETYAKLPLMRAEYLLLGRRFPVSPFMELGAGDIISVEKIEYRGADGLLAEVNPLSYSISILNPAAIEFVRPNPPFADGKADDSVRIYFTAGAASAADVAPLRKQALLAQVAWFYENRGDGTLSPGARDLIDLERIPTL